MASEPEQMAKEGSQPVQAEPAPSPLPAGVELHAPPAPPASTTLEKARRRRLFEYANWRVLVARVLITGLALLLVIVVLPGFSTDGSWEAFVFVPLIFGVVVALVRPLLEFFLLPYLFQTLGFALVLIEILLLLLLDWVVGDWFEIGSVLALVVGAVLTGAVSLVLEGLFGVTEPVVDSHRLERRPT